MNIMKKLLVLMIIAMSLPAMAMGPLRVDANGYRYEDEGSVQDKRKIAILAYDSLFKHLFNQSTGAKLMISGAFAPINVTVPVSLSRISQTTNRVSEVIDSQGEFRPVYAAQSSYQYLPNARNNLAAREGAPYEGQADGYDLSNIFYMKKLFAGRRPDSNEEEIAGAWVIRKAEESPRQKLSAATKQAIVKWADANGYNAVIWSSFPPNTRSQAEIVQKLLSDPKLLSNTQDYIQNLPGGPKTTFEQVILAGPVVLRDVAKAIGAPSSAPAPAPAPVVRRPADRERHYKNFTYYQTGDLPIILTAPHGGEAEIPGVPDREGGPNVSMFVTVLDDGTLELAQEVSDELYRILRKRPYLVAANFTREQIDANRAPKDAYESRGAKVVYDFYHGKIAEYVADIKNRFGNRALLLDLHGQGTDEWTVYRGTRDRTTVQRLINRDGEAAFTGPNSILGILAQKDNRIYPRNSEHDIDEKSIYSGGYTVGHYGSNNDNGIDAIQLENGWELRRSGRAVFAKELAEAIATFYRTYLAR